MSLLDKIKGVPSASDLEITKRLKNRMPSAKIVGRGTVAVSSDDVVNSEGFKAASQKAKEIVNSSSSEEFEAN